MLVPKDLEPAIVFIFSNIQIGAERRLEFRNIKYSFHNDLLKYTTAKQLSDYHKKAHLGIC